MSKNLDNRLESNDVHLSPIGLGIEHFARGVRSLKELSRDENSKLIIEEAYKLGITHFDLVFNLPYFFQVFKDFIKDKRKKITFTTHLGSFYNEKANGHSKTRSLNKIQSTYEGMLESLDVDYADIALIQFVTNKDDFEDITKRGILKYALQLKKEGKTKAVGISAHKPDLLMKIIKNGDFDVIMFPLNFATGSLDSTKKLIGICKKENIPVIGIKNLLKGKVFSTKRTNYPAYFCGGRRFSIKLDDPATPADCLNYGFDMGADTVVFGVKTVDELIYNMRSIKEENIPKNYIKTAKYFEEAIHSSH